MFTNLSVEILKEGKLPRCVVASVYDYCGRVYQAGIFKDGYVSYLVDGAFHNGNLPVFEMLHEQAMLKLASM